MRVSLKDDTHTATEVGIETFGCENTVINTYGAKPLIANSVGCTSVH